MNLHNLKTVATYNARLLLRSWLFRIFFLLTFCCIVLYQIFIQSNLYLAQNSGLITLSSFFPYMNAYLFAGLQVIPLIFLAGMFLTRERRVDSMDAIYYRPESNAEYVLGMAGGFAGVFIIMAVVSLFLSFLLHLFASDSPLNIGIYLFYLVTLIIPALIFMLGYSFFIHTWVRNQALSILILLVSVGFIIFYVGDAAQGVFDPFGHSLPNAFSGVTGHPDMAGYLLQRFSWLLVGLGFLGFTVALFKRLSNRPVNRIRVMGISVVCMVAGILAGGIVYSFHGKEVSTRKVYTETYNKYNDVPKASVIKHDISFEQQGDNMSAKSTLVLRNRTRETLPEIVLYLNPALEVLAIKGEAELPFEREQQVIRVLRELQPNQEITLEMEYRGGIDERLCYLDVPDDMVFDQEENAYLKCRYGKRFMFLTKDYTFLTPECLWYPTAVPPVNPAHSYEIASDFTSYSLRVLNPGERTVIAQGDREVTPDGLHFTNALPLHGLSLCIGDYKKREIAVDSVRYELYLFKGHDDILRGLEDLSDSIPALIREIRGGVEERMFHAYPYTSFKVVETPITLASFFRQEKGGSEFVQPEMVFLPERGIGVWSDYKVTFAAHMKMIAQYSSGMDVSVTERLHTSVFSSVISLLTNATTSKFNRSQFLMRWFGPSAIRNVAGEGFSTRNSLYCVAPLFYDYSLHFQSDDYPVINAVLLNILKTRVRNYSRIPITERVQDYLASRSLEEAFYDRELDPVVFSFLLRMKTGELVRRLSLDDITEEQVIQFLNEYASAYRFQEIDFNSFDEAFTRSIGVSWKDILPSWYTNNRLPEFLIREFKVDVVKTDKEKEQGQSQSISIGGGESVFFAGGGSEGSRVRVSVFNDSDVDGVISIEARALKMPPGGFNMSPRGQRTKESIVVHNYLVKANSGKEIVTYFDEGRVSLNTNLSVNIPLGLDGRIQGSIDQKPNTYVKDIDRSDFFAAENGIVVDNEDEGFRIVQSSPRKRLRDWFGKEKKSKYNVQGFSVQLMDGVEVLPGYVQGESAYGLSKRTHAFMMQGGGASMEWVTPIEREGEYDLYAYLPLKVNTFKVDKDQSGKMMGGFTIMSSFSTDMKGEEFKQYYTLVNGGEEKEIVGECDGMVGWTFLGRFRLTPGECKVVLTDRGEPDQVLLGDAVRWEYVADK